MLRFHLSLVHVCVRVRVLQGTRSAFCQELDKSRVHNTSLEARIRELEAQLAAESGSGLPKGVAASSHLAACYASSMSEYRQETQSTSSSVPTLGQLRLCLQFAIQETCARSQRAVTGRPVSM